MSDQQQLRFCPDRRIRAKDRLVKPSLIEDAYMS